MHCPKVVILTNKSRMPRLLANGKSTILKRGFQQKVKKSQCIRESECRIALIVFDLTVGVSYPFIIMKKMLTSCFGLGRLPLAPGTWGSLPPVIIFAFMCYFGVSVVPVSIVMVVLAAVGSFVCVRFAGAVIVESGRSDPLEVVADEFAGQALTFIGACTAGLGPIVTAAIGFVLFRLFDILKPWPIRKFEKLPSGWGVLADDLLAGVYAAIVLQICIRL